jgi:cytochrome c biogenesis protein CcmG/thiol:disulfide interchange protein DsbE
MTDQTAPPSRRRLALVVAVAFLAFVGLLAWGIQRSAAPDRDALPSPLVDRPAPDFSLPILHAPSQEVSAADLRGEPYVLNVWGSWCPACQDEHPVLTRYAETRRIRVIGYNWKDEPTDALRWLERFGNPYWVVLADQEGRTAIDWGIYGAPETFLVDAAGMVRWKHVGPLTDAIIRDELAPRVDALQAAAGRVGAPAGSTPQGGAR